MRNAYKARSCIKCITPEAYSRGAPPSRPRESRPRMSEASSRTWPVEKGMRVHTCRFESRDTSVIAKFLCFWSDPLRKHSLARHTWIALAVVSLIGVLRLLKSWVLYERKNELLEKIMRMLDGPGIQTPPSSRSNIPPKPFHATTGPHKPRERLQGHPEGGEITASNACNLSNRIRTPPCFVSLS
jgi:hypothetical protein